MILCKAIFNIVLLGNPVPNQGTDDVIDKRQHRPLRSWTGQSRICLKACRNAGSLVRSIRASTVAGTHVRIGRGCTGSRRLRSSSSSQSPKDVVLDSSGVAATVATTPPETLTCFGSCRCSCSHSRKVSIQICMATALGFQRSERPYQATDFSGGDFLRGRFCRSFQPCGRGSRTKNYNFCNAACGSSLA